MPALRGAYSVIDEYHPQNAARHCHNASGRYTYRPRTKKLKYTLGWELEANHAPTRTPAGVEHISDGSVNGDGAEFVVLPAVTKSPRYVMGLLKELVHAPELNTDKSCGFHVHVSAMGLSVANMRKWAIATEHLALQIEDAAFKAVPDARQSNQYCRRIRPIQPGFEFSATKYSNDRRYNWFNTVEMFRPGGIRTMEIRLLGNTHRWKYLLAWTLFSLELARRGWEICNHPFNTSLHVEAMHELLARIENEIKPLDKRGEPIPQWIYNGLAMFDMPANSWERPLSKLAEAESDVKGLPKKYYSDNQRTVENETSEDDDCCPCGCGDEGRCSYQVHSDGDCDSSDCQNCHENGDCTGETSCYFCDRDAERARQRERQARPVTSASATMTSNVVSQSEPLTIDSVQRAVDAMRNVQIDNAQLAAYRMGAEIYGRSIIQIVHDEGILEVNEAELERLAYMRLDNHEAALTVERERVIDHREVA